MYLGELRDEISKARGKHLSLSTIWRTLHRTGYPRKKVSQESGTLINMLSTCIELASSIDPTNLFLSTRAPWIAILVVVVVATQKQIYRHYKRFFLFVDEVLPALSLSGILLVDIIEGSFTKRRFSQFIDALLDQMNPFPGPNSVVVMDNCSIHK
ncbi:hypothetical protein BDR04DRAFT_959368, partial [Suillus decipiens]